MTKHDFFHSTPNDIEIFLNAWEERTKGEVEANFERMKYSSWLTGLYVQNAIASCFSKKCKYPRRPYGDNEVEDVEIVTKEEMTQSEVIDATETFFDRLLKLQKQAEIAEGI